MKPRWKRRWQLRYLKVRFARRIRRMQAPAAQSGDGQHGTAATISCRTLSCTAGTSELSPRRCFFGRKSRVNASDRVVSSTAPTLQPCWRVIGGGRELHTMGPTLAALGQTRDALPVCDIGGRETSTPGLRCRAGHPGGRKRAHLAHAAGTRAQAAQRDRT
jgi:hypothetical protein